MDLKPARLSEQFRTILRIKHYSLRTEKAYINWVSRLIRFHKNRSPGQLGEKEVRDFLSYLAKCGNVSTSTQNQAFHAIIFFYKYVMKRELGIIDAVRAKRPVRLPVVLTRDETKKLLSYLTGVQAIMAGLLYGSGL